MQFFPIMYVPADIGSDISDIGLTQPCTTSTWISFKWVLTIPVVSSWTQTMENVRRVLVVFVTRVVHVTKVLWTTQCHAVSVTHAGSIPPCFWDLLVRGIWILSSMASFPPAIPSARFVDNLKLKCKSNICEAQSPCLLRLAGWQDMRKVIIYNAYILQPALCDEWGMDRSKVHLDKIKDLFLSKYKICQI